LDIGEDPVCPRCGQVMLLAAHEVREGKPYVLSFRCGRCGRSERVIFEEE
jgi:ribosomal protein S27AE